MRWKQIVENARVRVIDHLAEAPHYAELVGRDGLGCRVWRNPSRGEFSNAIRQSPVATAGLRGLLTATDLYVWQSTNLLHADFERHTGIQGVRIGLRSGAIQLNDETIAMPEHFPWIFPDADRADEMNTDDRLVTVITWLRSNTRIARLYPQGFTVDSYQ